MADSYRRSVITSTALILGSFVLAAFALIWLTRDLKLQTDKVVATRMEIRKNTRSVELLAQLKSLAPEIATYEQKIGLLLPSKDSLLEFPKWVEGIARVNRIALNFSFQGGTTAGTADAPGYAGFGLDISGNYEDLKNFLREFEVSPSRFLVTLDNFDARDSGSGYRIISQGKVFFK